ncbi:hypothetical protein L3Y34_011690 [Caenorhabditis briggsae]|uniref:Sulfhydryl oxidase n=2 Tax=Caenorhabditis briggsae TaxID=6238 RepID=A0AAE8ZPH2_CAEBR|nr:hypothetical protein L3Y34_011690 [Caenorhabditis briggsae]
MHKKEPGVAKSVCIAAIIAGVFMLFVLVVILAVSAGRGNGESLYDKDDPILELDVDTFNPAIYGVKKAHFVEFYSSWCGACIGYAPTFKKFAKQLEKWAPLVQVTVVNCADDKNMPLCREHSVSSYPSLRYFKYNSASKDDGMKYSGDKYDINKLAHDIAGLAQADAQRQNPENWPTFLPLSDSTTLEDVFKSIGSTPYLAIVVQDSPSVIAWSNLINYHGNNALKVAYVEQKHQIALKFFSDGGAHALLFSNGNAEPMWKSSSPIEKWLDVQEKVEELIGDKIAARSPTIQPVNAAPVIAAPSNPLNNQFEVQLVDLKSAMSYMLYKEIPRREEIRDEPLAALKQWMHTLKKYAPGTTPMRRLFFRLDEWIQLRSVVTANEWTAKVDEIQQALGNPLPKEITWMACAGSKPNLRGYTCGLWTLAHTITVEAYKQEKHNTAFKPVIDVLEPFRAFIFHFLSCSECAQNFTKEAEKNQLHLVTRAEDVYAWLWRVHNFVNKRLSGSLTDDPSFKKQQFPPKSVCPDCYDSNGEIDEAKALPFVFKYYSNIKTDPAENVPGYKVVEYKEGKTLSAGQRHLNPKFQVHAGKVDQLEANEKVKNVLDASPQRTWKDIDGYDNIPESSRTHWYFIWLSLIGVALIVVYCKYRKNRSKFWKTFYYQNDFKLCPWSSSPVKQNIV